VIRREDVDVLVEECELAKDKAEALLRRHQGSLQEAMSAYIRGEL
jgi:NACalpha-BTF3-like transcription factor